MIDVIVEVRGGNVVGLYARRPDTCIAVVDWDNKSSLLPNSHAGVWKISTISKLPYETKGAVEDGTGHLLSEF